MSDEMEKQSVEQTTDVAENGKDVTVEENVAEKNETVQEEKMNETMSEDITAEEKADEIPEGVTTEQSVWEPAPVSPQVAVVNEPVPKKHGKLWIGAAAIVVVLALVIANAPKIGNAAVKLFTSPAGYFQHVMKKASNEAAEQFAKGYDIALENMFAAEDAGSETEMSVTFGEDVRELIGEAAEMDFDWMEKISLLVNADSTRESYKMDLGLALNDNRLISLILMANLTDGVGYLQVPELNESYLGMDLEELFEQADVDMDMEDINETYEMYEKLYQALPDKSKVEKLLKRYSELAIACVEDVEQDKEEVTVDEITNTFTVLEATIDEETLQDMLEVIVAELKKDKDIKEIMYDVLATQEDVDADEVYEEFMEALDELEEELDELDEENFELVLKLYVDNDGTIMGCVVEQEEADVEVSNLMVKKGSKFAYEFEVKVSGVKVVLEGTGKLTATKMSGDFKLKAVGMKLLEITMADIKVKDLEDGYFNGTISVSLGSAAAKVVEEALDGFPFDVKDLVLEFKEESSKNKSDMTMSLFEEDKLLGAFSVVSKTGKADNISSPKENEVVMVEEDEDLLEWIGDIDLDAFLESLEEKVDEDVLELFDGLMNGDALLPDYRSEDDWY